MKPQRQLDITAYTTIISRRFGSAAIPYVSYAVRSASLPIAALHVDATYVS